MACVFWIWVGWKLGGHVGCPVRMSGLGCLGGDSMDWAGLGWCVDAGLDCLEFACLWMALSADWRSGASL